ncbi:MAG: alkaline phosphatase family protein [Planctomycetota bacterium]|jgi:predicted AlkP superfamily phosphohydrolase/phosphomutase
MSVVRKLLAFLSLSVAGVLVYEEAIGVIRFELDGVVRMDADSDYGLLRLLLIVWIARLLVSLRGAWRPGLFAWVALLAMPALYVWLDADERVRRSILSVTSFSLLFLLLLADATRRDGPFPSAGRALAPARRAALALLALAVVFGVGWISVDRYRHAQALGTTRPTVTSGAPSPREDARLLLIGLDGANWTAVGPLIEAGELPNLARLVEAGHSGRLESRQTWRPSKDKWGFWSPVSWTIIATGYTEHVNGVVDFTAPMDPAFPDGRQEEVSRKHWRARPFWEVLSEVGVRSSVFGWWATWPALPFDGELVTLKFGLRVGAKDAVAAVRAFTEQPESVPTGHVWPDDLLARHAAELRLPRDDQAFESMVREHVMDFDRNDGVEPDKEVTLRNILWQDLVYKELARSALAEGKSRLVSFYCEGTDTAQHYFWQYRGDPLDELAAVGEQPERLRDAVDNYYRMADEWVGELLDAAGPGWNVLVISDHGHRDDERNTRRKSDHDQTGLYIASGPDFRQGRWPDEPWSQRLGLERKQPGNLDIAPTILYLFGAPLAADRDGRVLTPLFREELLAAQPLAEVPTWTHGADDLLSEDDAVGDDADREAMLERLRQLGYIDD